MVLLDELVQQIADLRAENERLRATIARVEALADEWDRTARIAQTTDQYERVAGSLRAALADPEAGALGEAS
jgi:hypothetical protein